MRKKIFSMICYILGWIYPLCVSVYLVLDRFFSVKTKLTGPFDFGNDSIMGYVWLSMIIGFITFLVCFVFIKVKLKTHWSFYLTLLNIPINILSVYAGFYEYEFPNLSFIIALLSLVMFIFTVTVTFKGTAEKEG